MLPSGHRMRRRDEFTLTVRRGRRAGRPTVVVHLLRRDETTGGAADSPGPPAGSTGSGDRREAAASAADPPRVGFIVSRTVGNAVVRNRVRRRLRHLVRGHLDRLPEGSLLVVRANPAAGTARYGELAADLESALDRLLRPTSKGRR
ncbi:ribonuclease P protein component [Actinomadura sp. NBRC 104412]|uniref:ribonuclease P protein component n=1 Tax=Actinomadura sp. NBRC 104412 TaxID=3032203 RepID=UPI00249F9EC2|nr:ribonuclease P protein component [Actinomadura sp. NBRC 104412]GLZ08790.1 ribonuclease P protein component [Actinomadura sp. NBRC 104412]